MNCNREENQMTKKYDKKEVIFSELRKRGFKITNPRKMIIDIILADEYSSCKEIYYESKQKYSSIGIATVYRMVQILEDIGVIDQKNRYHITNNKDCYTFKDCSIILKSKKKIELTMDEYKSALQFGLEKKGIITNDDIENVIVKNLIDVKEV